MADDGLALLSGAGMDDFERLGFPGERITQELALPLTGIVEFNPDAYVLAFPDVALSIESGEVASALDHYEQTGRAERRLEDSRYIQWLAGGCDERPAHDQFSFNVEAFLISESGVAFIVGWSDDRAIPLLSISLIQNNEGQNSRAIARCRRVDVEQALAVPPAHAFGFWMLDEASLPPSKNAGAMLRGRFEDGGFTQLEMTPRLVSDSELRETVLGHFASLTYLGNRDIEAFKQLDAGAGAALVSLNRAISSRLSRLAHVERFGPTLTRYAASFIICLFGKPEYFFLQNALFAPGANEIEFIYVSNSPELAETLHKEARIAERIYGLSITLITLPDNAGFSAANNVAAAAARSDRLVFLNPDVFPRDDGWAKRHAAILDGQPAAATKIFGAPLYYDDGSLMHGGMYFEVDRGLSIRASGIEAKSLIRVEHYGKGAPAWSDTYSAARPVPAITGAFMSIDRAWFEHLDGFNEDYIFGHYEDADLCLRSLQNDVPAWLQDIRFWHLEGKGSVRRPVHEGGSLVNRWYFTRQWMTLIEEELAGRSPSHKLLQRAASAKPENTGLKRLAARLTRRPRPQAES